METIDADAATIRPHYEPLLEKDAIRLLILYPGLPDDEISCSLLHVRFCESPRYEALSYMWGSEEDQIEILLDGNKLSIRNNLWQALKHLRSERYKRFLWADALCIDQENEKERNHQVGQMSDIYEQATRVRVWLGLEDKEGELAAAMKVMSDPTRCRSDYEKLLELPYWSRLWIVQEIVLSRNITIHLGCHTKSWETFSKTIRQHYDPRVLAKSGLEGTTQSVSPAVSICFTRHVGSTESEIEIRSLLSLMERYQYAKCCDARDKVFGLHSLALPCCRIAIPIDYSLDNHHLFERVMQHHYKHHWTKILRWSVALKPYFLDFGKLSWLTKYSAGPSFRLQINALQVSRVILTAPCYSSTLEFFVDMVKKYLPILYDSPYDPSSIDPTDIEMFRREVGANLNTFSPSGMDLMFALYNIEDNLRHTKHKFDGEASVEDLANGFEQWRPEDCLVYYGENEQVGLAPSETKPGDLICRFGRRDKGVMVIHPVDRNFIIFQLIGRAVKLSTRYDKCEVLELSLTIEEIATLRYYCYGKGGNY